VRLFGPLAIPFAVFLVVASTYAAAPAPAPAPVVATLPVPMTREAAIARARAIRDLVSRGETNGLWSDFNARMRDAVTDSVSYATTNSTIHAQIGAIDSVLSEEVSESESLIVVRTRCRFERLAVPGRVVSTREAIELLDREPALAAINQAARHKSHNVRSVALDAAIAQKA